jgi:hypothetical protein
MFCPICGREDSQVRRFCPNCGANLETVIRSLSPGGLNFLVRADQALDRLVGRYAGLFFGGAREKAIDWRVGHSWTLWLQAFLALPANFILFWIMLFGILPLRLTTLLLGSPFRLLSERFNQQVATPVQKVENNRAQLQAPPQGRWALDSGPSAVEHTTMNLTDSK